MLLKEQITSNGSSMNQIISNSVMGPKEEIQKLAIQI